MKKVTDAIGTRLEVGDVFSYPCRREGVLAVRTARITKISPEGTISAQRKDGNRVRILNTSRILFLPRTYLN